MLTPELLNKLRGISTPQSREKPAGTQPNQTASQSTQAAPQPTSNVSSAGQPTAPSPQDNPEEERPIEVPCRYYDDEEGHFAYIDGKTHQPVHFNTDSGRTYTQNDINFLSLRYAARNLSPKERRLRPEQVINDNTLYDKFGSPVFTTEEIMRAAAALPDSEPIPEGMPRKDKWGYPI